MQSLKFKTTIKCMGCVQTVGPALNEIAGQENWSVDLQSPERILTVQSENLTPKQIIDVLAGKGYQAESIQS